MVWPLDQFIKERNGSDYMCGLMSSIGPGLMTEIKDPGQLLLPDARDKEPHHQDREVSFVQWISEAELLVSHLWHCFTRWLSPGSPWPSPPDRYCCAVGRRSLYNATFGSCLSFVRSRPSRSLTPFPSRAFYPTSPATLSQVSLILRWEHDCITRWMLLYVVILQIL